MSVIEMPQMVAGQSASWLALLDLYDKVSSGWTLIGGQLVHLHCAERDGYPDRPTDDIDAVVDIRADTTVLAKFTRALLDLGFEPDTSGDGLQHRWHKGAAQVDVLLPDGVGEEAASRPGAGGAPSLPTPGGSQALHRSEVVRVRVDGREGSVLRPNLVGALVMKAAAHTVPAAGRGRHRIDFVVLAALLDRTDFSRAEVTKKDRQRLRFMVDACRDDPTAMLVEQAEQNLGRLERAAGLAPAVARPL